jgi:beta-glucosidase
MGKKPVIVVVRMHNPCILAELEPAADAIVVDFGVQQEAILTIVSGQAEPSGLLPVQLPRDMETVEAHCEDKPLDLIPYTDDLGNAYDFAFGLNWSGVIHDSRTMRYPRP